MHRASERGQALPLMAAVLAVAALFAFAVAELGVAAVHRAQARTAADAAALAGAAAGEGAARDAAVANGAELVAFVVDGPIVEVVVTHGRARARATAEGYRSGAAGVAPALAAALARAEQLLGRPVPVLSTSEGGTVVAVPPALVPALDAVREETGLCRRGGDAGPVDFAPCPPSSPG